MGMINPPKNCFITDSQTQNSPSSWDAIEYESHFAGKKFKFAFDSMHKNSEMVEKSKYILQGLIINDKFPYSIYQPFFNNERLEKIINEAVIPKTPKDKLDNLLSYLHSLQDFEGSSIDTYSEFEHDLFLKKLYFKNHNEYWFYLKTLYDIGLLTFIDTSSLNGNEASDIKFTFSGLEYIIQLQEEGSLSKKAFVAMSFSETMNETRSTIKSTISDCGYEPILVDEINYESDITINDAIISNIKSSKFLIADFTQQKRGVYFEAGYALGKNKPVIYLCQKDDFENSHFDTNHYPHIVYEDIDDLKEKLICKIQAWIE